MCGIFGYSGTNQRAADLVLDGLKRLEYRGYDSWGVAVLPSSALASGSEIALKKNVGKIGDGSAADLPEGTLALGHTRWATHGGVTQLNAHPHLDCSGHIAVVHNGIFENYQLHKDALISKSHTFISETDSEVIAHVIEDLAKTMSFFEAVRAAFLDMAGLNALIAVNLADRTLVAARNGSPLVLGFGENENYIASDPAALLVHTKDVYFLEDQEMAIVRADSIEVFDAVSGRSKPFERQRLEWDSAQTEKGKYAHFMLKEIYEQPKVVAAIAASASVQTQAVSNSLKAATKVNLIGCGSAAHACQIGYYLLSKLAHKSVSWAVGSEFSYNASARVQSGIVMALSQSGETMDILEPLKRVKQDGIKILALVNVLGSSLYRLADEKILLGAGPERAVASTKAFTAKLAHLVLLAYAYDDRLAEGKTVVARAAEVIEHVLSETSVKAIHDLAVRLKNSAHMYCLGRGVSYPLALEAALKIKEVSYIHAEGLATGELKHGTLALVEKGTPCLVFLPDDETFEANLAGAMEVKARGGYIVGIASKPQAVFDAFIEVPDAREATCIPNAVVAQLLAYYLTMEKGLDPDMPRNLAKSVTVK